LGQKEKELISVKHKKGGLNGGGDIKLKTIRLIDATKDVQGKGRDLDKKSSELVVKRIKSGPDTYRSWGK